MKIHPVGAEVVPRGRAVGRSDITKLILVYAILRTRLMSNFKFYRWTMFGYSSKCYSHSFKHFGGETWGRQEQRHTNMACASFIHFVAAWQKHRIYIFFVFGEFLVAGFATGFDCGNLVIFKAENGILIT